MFLFSRHDRDGVTVVVAFPNHFSKRRVCGLLLIKVTLLLIKGSLPPVMKSATWTTTVVMLRGVVVVVVGIKVKTGWLGRL